MNIVIYLDCQPELKEKAISTITAALDTIGLNTKSCGVDGMNAFHCVEKSNDECIPPEEIGPVPPEATTPPEISVTSAGIVAMVDVPPIAPQPEETQLPSFSDVRVLTLSTSFFIPVTSVSSDNTVLKVLNLAVSSEDGIARFSYNGFVHALPIYTQDGGITNPQHAVGPTTVRLVIDINHKICPCLVDLDNGDKEELLVGSDLLSVIAEETNSVSTE